VTVTVLGSGTSHGIPVIGCHCPVCESNDSRDKRYRSSVMLEKDGHRVVIDTGYEFRLQMLRESVDSLDAVFYTHSHSDHMSGIDDLRVFSQERDFPVYADWRACEHIRHHYPYAVTTEKAFRGVPNLEPIPLESCKHYSIAGFDVVPVCVEHGKMTHMRIFGYRFDDFAYVTDVTYIPKESMDALRGVKLLIIGALREKPHGAHFSFKEAYEAALSLGARRVYMTHFSHATSAKGIDEYLTALNDSCGSPNKPDVVLGAYDGLKLEV